MSDVKDPRTDRSNDGPKYPTPPGEPSKAPGGAGTGTEETKTPVPPSQPKP